MCNAAIYRPTAKEPEFTADGYETRSDPPVDPTPYAPNAGVQSSTHAPCNGRPLFLPRQSQRGAAAAGHNEVKGDWQWCELRRMLGMFLYLTRPSSHLPKQVQGGAALAGRMVLDPDICQHGKQVTKQIAKSRFGLACAAWRRTTWATSC